jgi:hypothetical protein
MDGRVMSEFFVKSNSKLPVAKPQAVEVEAKNAWGTYRLKLNRSVLGKKAYVDSAMVNRVYSSGAVN